MSVETGGYLRGPWWRYRTDDETKTRRCYVVAWGGIVREPSETFTNTRVTRFVIKTGRGAGRSEKHLVCVAYGEQLSAVIMRAMERGDVVICAGTWTEKINVKTKKGVRETYDMSVSVIIPMGLVGFLLDLYGTPSITGAVEERRNEDSDPWESD